MSTKIPETPSDQIGKELSLNQLIVWFNNVKKEIDLDIYIQPDMLNVLDEYKKDSESTWSNGKYYQYGQIPTHPDDAITQKTLQIAIDTNSTRLYEYGGPCNSFEADSISNSEKSFTNLLKLLDFYYYRYNEIIYAPEGPGYKKALEAWTDRIDNLESK